VLPRHWWCPRAGELAVTCLDAGPAIGAAIREFGGVVLATATPGPADAFAEACGLADFPLAAPAPDPDRPDRLGTLNRRDTRRLFTQVTRGRELLAAEAARESAALAVIRAQTPWRTGAYSVAVDLRVDTTFQQRTRHHDVTAATVAALAAASGSGRAAAVFFPSYAYAEAIARTLADRWPELPVALQPRQRDLSAQAAWVESSLTESAALFLVLGSSFAESIDLLGGRVTHAMVVGPALPEVNPVQRAKLALLKDLGRDAAFDRVYRIPGMQKVNQALGRLVRAPGQRAAVLLHCRRFAEPGYARLLAEDYQSGRQISRDEELADWLANPW
jgi:Rad3-related DNA helicase